ncbi:unnamed protein product [Anisakis simplex]|uniref:Transposase n=1 Tax=Anisakis simplex TaxID=6269 RepID=A0A0M3JMI5_ANISI|nr:unnamed protein product [Anisakis simplex]
MVSLGIDVVCRKEGHLAVMSHDRELEISDLEENELVTRSRVKGY